MGFVAIAFIVTAVVVVCSAFSKPPPPRRIIWRDTNARARMRIGERWEPMERCEGQWDIKKGEVRR